MDALAIETACEQGGKPARFAWAARGRPIEAAQTVTSPEARSRRAAFAIAKPGRLP
jgi:hypothetical protein